MVEGGSINGTSAAQAAEVLAGQVSALAELHRFNALEGLAAQKSLWTMEDKQIRVRSASVSKVRSQEDELSRVEERR